MAIRVNGDSTSQSGISGDVVGPASAVDDNIVTFDGTTGKITQDGGETIAEVKTAVREALTFKIGITVDGGGLAITTGVKGYTSSPIAGTIVRSRILLDQSGSIVFDVWKDVFANYPPTVADTITAAAKPTVTTDTDSEDATLTGWTTSVAAGDVFGFNVDSITTATRATLEIWIQPT